MGFLKAGGNITPSLLRCGCCSPAVIYQCTRLLARADARDSLEHPLTERLRRFYGCCIVRILTSAAVQNAHSLSSLFYVCSCCLILMALLVPGATLKGLVPIITAEFERWVVRFVVIDSYWKSKLCPALPELS